MDHTTIILKNKSFIPDFVDVQKNSILNFYNDDSDQIYAIYVFGSIYSIKPCKSVTIIMELVGRFEIYVESIGDMKVSVINYPSLL